MYDIDDVDDMYVCMYVWYVYDIWYVCMYVWYVYDVHDIYDAMYGMVCI